MSEQPRFGFGAHEQPVMAAEAWLTPPWIIAKLGGAESFDLDPCACPEPRPWPTARLHYTRADGNGRLKHWHGRVWLNPPYGPHVAPWLGRLADHGTGTALIFARTETEPFHRHVWRRATAILFLRGRLIFHRQNGEPAQGAAGAPSCLVAYGEKDAFILSEQMRDDGFFVRCRKET